MAGEAALVDFPYTPHMYVAKCDANGDLLWSQTLASSQGGTAWDIIECTDGGLVVAGAVNMSGDVQCVFMKMEADGTICPACGVEPYGSDSAAVFTPVDLTMTVFDNVATSTSYTVDVFPGGTAVIGCLETGVWEVADAYGLLEVSPNPAADHCTVSIDRASNIRAIELLSMQGSTLLRVAVNGSLQVNVPLGAIAQGTYVLRTIGSGRTQYARVVVAR